MVRSVQIGIKLYNDLQIRRPLGRSVSERVQGGRRFTSSPLPSPPLDPSAGPPCKSLGGQPRNIEARSPFQPQPAKTSYPKPGPPRGFLGDHLGISGSGFEVSLLGSEVSGPGIRVLMVGSTILVLGFMTLGLW